MSDLKFEYTVLGNNEKTLKFPTNEEIIEAFKGKIPGLTDSEIIPFFKNSLLKVACGYWAGTFVSEILVKLDMIKYLNKGTHMPEETVYAFTIRGAYCCYEWFKIE